MEKKKLTLSISGSSKKTFKNIQKAKNQSKNTVVIEKKTSRYTGLKNFSKNPLKKTNVNSKNFYSKPPQANTSDFEKRKLAEQRATKRLKGEESQRENKNTIFSS